MKLSITFATALVAAATLVAIPSAHADQAYNVDISFNNGATLVGTVSFNSSLTEVTAVDAVLTGYETGTYGFASKSDTDTIDIVSNGGSHVGSDLDLVTLTDAGWDVSEKVGKHTIEVPEDNFITLSFDVANPLDITLVTTGLVGALNNIDLDYKLQPVDVAGLTVPGAPGPQFLTATPEPGSMLLLGSGLLGMMGMIRRKIALRA